MLPHLGPDFGFCLLPPTSKDTLPQLLVAVRLNPGKKNLDRKLFTTLQFLVALGVTHQNLKHRDHIRVNTLQQGKVKVMYLDHGKEFPKGLRPAFALKEGYLVVASSPETILRFTAGPVPLPSTKEGAPPLRLSVPELTRI